MFHVAFLVIVLGAAITRYFGFEGAMMIREGEASNQIISSETYLQIKVHNNEQQYTYDMPVSMDTNSIAYVSEDLVWNNPLSFLFNHNNYFEHEFAFNEKEIKISCVDVIKNPVDTLIPDPEGPPYIDLVTGGMSHNYIASNETKIFESGLKVSFNNDNFTDAIRIFETDSGLYVMSPYDLNYMQMSDQSQGVIVRDSLQEFIPKRLYMIGNEQFVFSNYYLGAHIETMASNRYMNGLMGVTVKVEDGGESQEIMLKGGKGQLSFPTYFEHEGLFYEMSYGSKIIEIPFSIYLRDFQLERYPGTNNPSSFASEVTLIDPEAGVNDEQRIFMNNVLDYGGYRFFQSSYDPDELGTVLSVNHDRPGTLMTYLGYFLLGLGFIINLFSKKSRFRLLMKKSEELRKKREAMMATLAILFISTVAWSQPTAVDEEHAEKFGQLIVQDQGGRLKPLHTLAFDILKKVHRDGKYEDQSAIQVFVGIHANPYAWFQEPLIYVSGKPLREKYNLEGKHAALVDFIGPDMEYLLYEDADVARRKRPAERSQYDKDVLKTDERFNILSGLFNGFYLRIFPKPNDPTNTWYSPNDPTAGFEYEDSTFVSGVMKLYYAGAGKGFTDGDWKDANTVVDLISTYQQKTAPAEIMPSETKIAMEIFYNNADIFKRLMNLYLLCGLLLLIFAFIQVFVPRLKMKWPLNVGMAIFIGLFAFHVFGLGLRWYLSGHAPWSNGYEAVVFIAGVAVLAGILFSRTNKIVLGACGILAWLMLFVAHMNQMDPEITFLVPVLKSYWLMIHVAIITGSYAFLGLGAILGLITLIMNLFVNRTNRKQLMMTSKELTYISEMTMTVGLFMLTIGTFLGGVWANESWGRYWGWDAKETWALASVLIYAVVIHLRFVPGLKSQFAFNAASLWAYGSIIMTFFGVNYYLSGLHSYAQGDPMPVPTWVPITVWILLALTIISFFRWKAANRWAQESKSDTES